MSNTVEATGYGQGAAVVDDESSVYDMIDIDFAPKQADVATERAMYSNLVYGMAEDKSHNSTIKSTAAPDQPKLSLGYRFAKRAFDIVAATCGTVILSPVFLVTAIAIKITSHGSVIFKQKRYGKEKMPFDLYKFRSMTVETPPDVPTRMMNENKSCLTPIGGFIRKHSLDEFPQFINIIKGDIPQRILKTGQGGTFDSPSLFALPAKEMRTIKALFPQVKVTSGTYLRTVQNFLENLTAASAKSQAVFAKRVMDPVLGFNRRFYILPIMQMFKFAKAA